DMVSFGTSRVAARAAVSRNLLARVDRPEGLVGPNFQQITLLVRLHRVQQVAVVAVVGIGRDPVEMDVAVFLYAAEQVDRDFVLRAVLHVLRNASSAATGPIAGPFARQIKLLVQGDTRLGSHGHHEFTDLAVLGFSETAAPLAFDSHAVLAPLYEAGGIQHAHHA